MVHNVVWCVAHAKQRARGVQVAGHACADVHILPNALQRQVCLVYLFPGRALQPPGSSDISHLQLCSLMEIRSTDALPHNIPVCTTGCQAHSLLHHNVLELGTHLPHLQRCVLVRSLFCIRLSPPASWPQPHLPHGLGMDEVLIAPEGRIAVVLPLQVNIQVSQVIALWNSKFLSHLVTLLLSALKGKRRTRVSQRAGKGPELLEQQRLVP